MNVMAFLAYNNNGGDKISIPAISSITSNLNIIPEKKCVKTSLTKKVKEYFGGNIDYVIIDFNSITIVPYLTIHDYLIKGVNYTPFIRSVMLIKQIQETLAPKYIIGVIDNGVSRKLKKIINYKGNRKHSTHANLSLTSKNSDNLYKVNVKWLLEYMLAKKYMYLDISYGEADHKIAFFIKNLLLEKEDKNLVVLSADSDYLQLIPFVNIALYRQGKYVLFKKGSIECLNEFLGFDIINAAYYIFYKALVGDKTDNIPKILSEQKTKNIFKKYSEELLEVEQYINPENFINLIKKDLGQNENERQNKKSQFFKNVYAINMFNEEIFEKNELIMLKNSYKQMFKSFEEENPEIISQIKKMFKFLFNYEK